MSVEAERCTVKILCDYTIYVYEYYIICFILIFYIQYSKIQIMSCANSYGAYYNIMANNHRFTTYQDARRVRLVDGLETNILRVSPVKLKMADIRACSHFISRGFEILTLL